MSWRDWSLLTSPVFRKNPDLVRREIADETILVPFRGQLASLQKIHVLSPVAAFIWEEIDGYRDLEAILQAVLDRFNVGAEQARQDVEVFLAELEEARLVARVEGSSDRG
jgi:hypothetical protein